MTRNSAEGPGLEPGPDFVAPRMALDAPAYGLHDKLADALRKNHLKSQLGESDANRLITEVGDALDLTGAERQLWLERVYGGMTGGPVHSSEDLDALPSFQCPCGRRFYVREGVDVFQIVGPVQGRKGVVGGTTDRPPPMPPGDDPRAGKPMRPAPRHWSRFWCAIGVHRTDSQGNCVECGDWPE